ncbi:MAG: DsbA family oxidoreductase [Bacteroidia bacterium]
MQYVRNIFFTFVVMVLASAVLYAFPKPGSHISIREKMLQPNKNKQMKVEIWSDVMCPFCYIGKRKFEQALSKFPQKGNIEITWESYQLAPDMKTDTSKNINQYLAESKGWTLDYAKQMNDYVTNMAAEVGLTYNFEKAIPANSFDAHRISHLAAKYGLQDKMEETLFKAYFTDGKNTADKNTLIELGKEIGLDAEEVRKTLESKDYESQVNADIMEAQTLGVNGVPFFVFDRKYAVSGAQSPEVFLQTLEKSYQEWSKQHSFIELKTDDKSGGVCSPDGKCD